MTVTQKKVLEPIRAAYKSAKTFTDAEVFNIRDAAATVTHEAVHLASHAGDPTAPGSHPTRDNAGRAMEEGLAEFWTHRNLDDVTVDVGLAQNVPAILSQRTGNSY